MSHSTFLQAHQSSVLVQSAGLDDGLLTGIAQGVLSFLVEAFTGCYMSLCIDRLCSFLFPG